MAQTVLEPSPAQTASALTSNTWSITNTSGIHLVVIDALTDLSEAAAQLYDQTLSLLKTTDNQPTIRNGETKTITLPPTRLDQDNRPLDFTLLIANASTLFPIRLVEISGQQQSVPPTTVTAADLTSSQQAGAFVKVITAFPTSSLVSDYITALNTTDETAIAAFFAAQPNYWMVSLGLVAAVQTYYNRFPFFLTNYSSAKTYYLYTSDGTRVRYVGSVALENTTPAGGQLEEAMSGFSAMYITPNGANYVDLAYAQGQLVEDVESASPDYCLQGLFVLRSDLTKQEDDKDLMVILWGTVNGEVVFGYDVKQERSLVSASLEVAASPSPQLEATEDKKSNYNDLDIINNPDKTEAWLKLTGVVVGGLVGIALLGWAGYKIYRFAKWYKEVTTWPDPMTPQEVAERNQEIRERNRATRQRVLDKLRERVEIPTDFDASMAQIKEAGNDILLNDNKAKIELALDEQRTMIDLLNTWANPALSDRVHKSLDELQESMSTTNALELGKGTRMKEIMDQLNRNTEDIYWTFQQAGKSLRGVNATQYETSQKALELSTSRLKANEEIRESLEEREIPEIEE